MRDSGVNSDLFHLVWLAPLKFPNGFFDSLRKSKLCVIVDSDFEYGGLADTLAVQILKVVPDAQIRIMGLARKSAGFSSQTDNLTPSSSEIREEVMSILSERSKKSL